MYLSQFSPLLHLLVAVYRGVFRNQSNFFNEAFFFAKILNRFRLLAVKKAPSQMFDWVENRFLGSGKRFEILTSRLFPVSKLSRENTMPENACDIKDKRLWWVLIQKQPSEGFLKKGVMRNFGKFTRKWLCRTNEALAQVFSCEFCKICKNTFSHFLQNTTGQLLLIIVVLVVVKGELANETVNYDTKTKAYVSI